MPLPDWPEIYREAVTRDDEHDLSLSSRPARSSGTMAIRLYNYAAAKRLNLA